MPDRRHDHAQPDDAVAMLKEDHRRVRDLFQEYAAASGTRQYNAEQRLHGQAPVSMRQYLGTARFWFESFQNWQSEFLAVGSVVVVSIWLRECGSPESKPVHRAHAATGR